MSDAYIVGAAMTRFGKYETSSYSAIGMPVVRSALQRANVEIDDVNAVFCGNLFGGSLTGQRIVRDLGMGGIPIFNVEDACSSSGVALHLAVAAVRAQKLDVAIVVGVEKLSKFGGGPIPMTEEDYEAQRGVVMPAVYAMRAQRFLFERKVNKETLAKVTVKSRHCAVENPYAQFRKETTIEEVMASRTIADPLTLFQCCPTGDGAACLVIMSEKKMRASNVRAVRIKASIVHSGQPTTGFRDMTKPEITARSSSDAYAEAGISPKDLDIVELHDAFTIAELIYYEALGLCEEGGSIAFLESGQSTFGGQVVVNPSGGLLSRGHPVGATGAAQAAEIYWQLTNQAGNRQVAGAKLALSHVTGGGIGRLDHGACTVHIYEAAT